MSTPKTKSKHVRTFIVRHGYLPKRFGKDAYVCYRAMARIAGEKILTDFQTLPYERVRLHVSTRRFAGSSQLVFTNFNWVSIYRNYTLVSSEYVARETLEAVAKVFPSLASAHVGYIVEPDSVLWVKVQPF